MMVSKKSNIICIIKYPLIVTVEVSFLRIRMIMIDPKII